MGRSRNDSDRAQSKACAAAVTYVRTHHPRVWRRLLATAYAELGVVRKPPGRPSSEQ